MATETTTEEDIYEALEEVIDPELGLDFVSLGLVYDVEIEGPEAFITFTLTTPACPIGPQVSEQMREFVGQIEGIDKVHPKMVFDPPWSPEMWRRRNTGNERWPKCFRYWTADAVLPTSGVLRSRSMSCVPSSTT